jgi:hypothetical protein
MPEDPVPKRGPIPTRITVQVDPKLVDASPRDTEVTRIPELESAARELRVAFRALHPGTSDPTLRTYVVVDADDPASAEHIAERLRANPAITAAYVKPPDAMP